MRRVQSVFILALTLLALQNTGLASTLIIDDFSAPQTGTGTVDDPGILGGERDVVSNGSVTTVISGGAAEMNSVCTVRDPFVPVASTALSNKLTKTCSSCWLSPDTTSLVALNARFREMSFPVIWG